MQAFRVLIIFLQRLRTLEKVTHIVKQFSSFDSKPLLLERAQNSLDTWSMSSTSP